MDNQTDSPTAEKRFKIFRTAGNAIKNVWNSNGKIKFILVALGIFVSFVYVGVFQETIMKGCYGEDKSNNCENGEQFKFASSLVLVKSFCGLVIISVINLIKPEKKKDETHFMWYASTAAANSLSMVSANLSLRWVSYPMQVIFKSAKPLSVMILGLMFCKRYTIQRYLFVLVIVTGVVVFKLFESSEGKATKNGEELSGMIQFLGTGLLLLSLSMDGVLGAIQDRMRATSKPTFRQLMFQMCAWVCGYLLIAILITREFLEVIPFISRHPSIIWHLTTFGIADAIGNMFIFTMISSFGALACSVTGTVRKFFSVIFSIIFFGNPSTPLQWVGAGLVFAGLFADAFFGKKKSAPKTLDNGDLEKCEEKTEDNEKDESKEEKSPEAVETTKISSDQILDNGDLGKCEEKTEDNEKDESKEEKSPEAVETTKISSDHPVGQEISKF